MDVIFISIIAIIGLYIILKFLAFLKKKGLLKFEKKPKQKKAKQKTLYNPGTVTLVDKYMYRREVKALIALNRVLPKQYIALPKVGVANLVRPEGTRNLFNTVKDYFVDFVIFEEATMKPLLVVDVYDNSFEDELLKHRHPDLIEVFDSLKLNYIEIAVRGEIDLLVLKQTLDQALGIKPENPTK